MAKLTKNKFRVAFSSKIPIKEYLEHDNLEILIEKRNGQANNILAQVLQIVGGDEDGKPKIEVQITCLWTTVKRIAPKKLKIGGKTYWPTKKKGQDARKTNPKKHIRNW